MTVPFVQFTDVAGRHVEHVSYGNREDAMRLNPGASHLRSDWVALRWVTITRVA